MAQSPHLQIIPVPLADEIRPGDSLLEELLKALSHPKRRLQPGDIL